MTGASRESGAIRSPELPHTTQSAKQDPYSKTLTARQPKLWPTRKTGLLNLIQNLCELTCLFKEEPFL